MKLDLHGKSHYEISTIVDRFLWESMQRNRIEVDIVTGNSERMKGFVIEILNEYELSYNIGDMWNNGYIRVFLK